MYNSNGYFTHSTSQPTGSSSKIYSYCSDVSIFFLNANVYELHSYQRASLTPD